MRALLVLRPRLSVLAAVAAVALPVAGCGSDDADPAGASAAGGAVDPASSVPASAPFYVEGVVRPGGELKTSIDALAGKFGVADPGAEIVKALDEELADDGATYAQDIEPWLGEKVGLAVTGYKADGADTDIVVSVAVKDTDAAEASIEKATKGDEAREYAGQTYRFDTADEQATALLGDTLVVATEPAFKAVVDARKGQSLAEAPKFTRARDVAGDEGAAFLYVDPTKIFDLVAATGDIPAAQLDMVRSALSGSGLQSVAGTLQLEDDEVLMDFATVGANGPTPPGDAAGAAAAAPAGAWLSLGVGDIDATVDQSLSSLAKAGGLQGMSPDAIKQQLNALAGFDVDSELLSWMGDATLWVRGTSRDTLTGALVVSSKDPAKSRASVGRLEQLLTGLGLAPKAIDDGLSVAVPDVGTVSIVARDDKFAIVFGDGVADALDPGATIGGTDAFEDAAGTLDGTDPVFLLDFPQVVGLLRQAAGGDEDFDKALPYLEKLGPMAAGQQADGDVRRAQLGISVP